MFLALALATVLGAEEVELDQEVENQRVVRIGATALGGGLGIALPMIVGLGLQALEAPCIGFGCSTGGGMAIAVGVLPFTFATGIGVPHTMRGGKAGIGFGLAGGVSGYMTAVSALGLLSALTRNDWAVNVPGAGAGLITALSLVGAVAAMELRHDELEAGAVEWRVGRGLAEAAVFWLAAAPLEAAFLFLGFATGSIGAVLALTVGTVITLAGASAASWGVHRGLDGRGKFWPTMVGAIAGATIGAAFMAMHFYAPPRGGIIGPFGGFNYTMVPLLGWGTLIGMTGPAVALEWSSSLNSEGVENEYRHKEPLDLQVQGGFGPNGGSIGLAGRF